MQGLHQPIFDSQSTPGGKNMQTIKRLSAIGWLVYQYWSHFQLFCILIKFNLLNDVNKSE